MIQLKNLGNFCDEIDKLMVKFIRKWKDLEWPNLWCLEKQAQLYTLLQPDCKFHSVTKILNQVNPTTLIIEIDLHIKPIVFQRYKSNSVENRHSHWSNLIVICKNTLIHKLHHIE